MRKVKTIVMALALLTVSAVPSVLEAKGWEVVKTPVTDYRVVAGDTDVEIRTDRGLIIVNSNKHVNIKIFTILGSQVANDNLAPGTYRFLVPAHGVYIVKAGELTCKVAI